MKLEDQLREEDVKPVKILVAYLIKNGFDVSLEGSAKRGNKTYRDVDLLCVGSRKDVDRFARLINKPFERTLGSFGSVEEMLALKHVISIEGVLYEVRRPLIKESGYVDQKIDYRGQFYNGNTEIDLSLKKKQSR